MSLSVAGGAPLAGARRIERAERRAARSAGKRTDPSVRSAIQVALFALFAAAAVTGYFAIVELEASGTGRAGPETVPAPLRSAVQVVPGTAAATYEIELVRSPASMTGPSLSPARSAALPAAIVAADQALARTFRRAPAPPARSAAVASSPPAEFPLPVDGPTDDGSANHSFAVAETATAPESGAVPDRWQAMAGALAQCEREGAIAGLICGQRVRLRYCDGHWGEVAQCPALQRNEYGG
jgi:hypothetical protein